MSKTTKTTKTVWQLPGRTGLIEDRIQDRMLSAQEVCDVTGLKRGTWDAYVSRGYAPEPSGRIGKTRWWWLSTIQVWMSTRPGRGHPRAEQ